MIGYDTTKGTEETTPAATRAKARDLAMDAASKVSELHQFIHITEARRMISPEEKGFVFDALAPLDKFISSMEEDQR